MQNGFDFDDILNDVIERAVGERALASDVTSARRSIYMILEDWHMRGLNTWRVRTQDYSFLPGTKVQLPSRLDDTLNVSILTGENQNEIPLTRLSDVEYAQITNKQTAGIPTQFYIQRTEPPTMQVYPEGRFGQSETVRVMYVERPDRFDRHSPDIDAPSRWMNALIFGAAADLASKRPDRAQAGTVGQLEMKYRDALIAAQGNDRQRKPFRMRIG